jgi:hypothetical protein
VVLTGPIGPMKNEPSTSISKLALRSSAAPCKSFVIVMTFVPIGLLINICGETQHNNQPHDMRSMS